MNEPVSTPKRGVLDFLKLIYDGHHEYAVMAVKAPFEETVRSFIDCLQERPLRRRMNWKGYANQEEVKLERATVRWVENIDMRSSKKRERLTIAFPFFQVKGSQWTVIQKTIFIYNRESSDMTREAVILSSTLQTQVVTFVEEDTSSAMGYDIFENGNRVERFECGDGIRFESKLRPEPAFILEMFRLKQEDEENIRQNKSYYNFNVNRKYDFREHPRVKFVNETFSELGIYIPACYPVTDDGKPMLAVDPASENTIDRADWIEVKYTLEA